jgi:ABC-type methionine transport system ATPase subunit
LLLRIQAETGCSLVLIEHDMPLVTSIAGRMIALGLGRVIASGTPAEVVHHPDVIASYLGTDDAAITSSGPTGIVAGTSGPSGRARRTRKAAASKP